MGKGSYLTLGQVVVSRVFKPTYQASFDVLDIRTISHKSRDAFLLPRLRSHSDMYITLSRLSLTSLEQP